MKILVANLGSTSLKWRLFDCANSAERLVHKGGFERVTEYSKAIEDCLGQLRDSGAIATERDLAAVGFKTIIAKGVTGCVRLDESVLGAMEAYSGLAPAHNPPYITGIRLFAKRMPGVPLIALFETAFYQFAPEPMMRYAVPERWHDIGVRRWGFHGASHKFIAERSAQLLGRDDVARRAANLYLDDGKSPVSGPDLRVISCHLGGTSSIASVRNGVANGNSLGMSPQSGLPHNNRVGDLDPEALPYAVKALGITIEEAQRQLSQEGGLKGLSGGFSNDVRDLREAAAKGNARAQLAIDVFDPGRSSRSTCSSARRADGSVVTFSSSTAPMRSFSPPASARTAPNCARRSARISTSSASYSTGTRTTRPAPPKPPSAPRTRA